MSSAAGTDPFAVTCEVAVTDVLRHPGERRPVRRELSLDTLVVATSEVPADATVLVDATVEAVHEGVLLAGTLTVPWVGACRRCLEPVTGTLEIPVRELFAVRSTPGESYPLVDERIDLVPLVTDAVLLDLPLAPLCSDECRGPDPERFPAQPAADEDDAPPPDPRWAALADVAFDLRSVDTDTDTDADTDTDTDDGGRG